MIAAAGATTIHAIARKHPELALCAAVVQRAYVDATAGDSEALEWLGSESCAWYLSHLETDQVVANMLQERLIEAVTVNGETQ
jgi:hypothetical protein